MFRSTSAQDRCPPADRVDQRLRQVRGRGVGNPAYAHARTLGDLRAVAAICCNQAILESLCGDLDEAERLAGPEFASDRSVTPRFRNGRLRLGRSRLGESERRPSLSNTRGSAIAASGSEIPGQPACGRGAAARGRGEHGPKLSQSREGDATPLRACYILRWRGRARGYGDDRAWRPMTTSSGTRLRFRRISR